MAPPVARGAHKAAMTTSLATIASRRDWQNVFALLDTALDLDPPSQSAWLDALGPEQARLSPLLRDLLQAHAAVGTGDFLRTSPTFAFAEPATTPHEVAAQSLIGPYRLLRARLQAGHGE